MNTGKVLVEGKEYETIRKNSMVKRENCQRYPREETLDRIFGE